MRIALDPEQVALKEELQDYFGDAGHARGQGGARPRPPASSARRASTRSVIQQLGTDGWLGIGWPEEWGGQNRSMVDQLIFTDVAADFGVPIPYLTLNTVGPTIMRYGTDEQKAVLPPQDPRRRPALLDRLLRARLRHRPGLAQDQGGPRGRRVGDQRPEDVDLADPVRRLDLAGLPHRPRPAPPQGALDDPGAGRREGLLLHAGAHRGRGVDERDVLRGRPRARPATWSASSTAAGR